MFLDKNIARWYRLKAMSLEEFAAQSGLQDAEKVYNAIQNAQQGHIKITKDGTREVHWGFTPGFCEGIGCYISNTTRWYLTSVIQKINWDEKYFITLNSKYWFEFDPVEDVEPIKEEASSE